MTVPVWPAELPIPLLAAYQHSLGDNRRMTSAEQGPPRVRRSYSRTADTVALTIYCTHDQRARFERFRIEEAGIEALPFAMTDPGLDGLNLWTEGGEELLTDGDEEILIANTWLCLFSATRPSFAVVGWNYWGITFEVLVLPS